jgi:hypothetical protein
MLVVGLAANKDVRMCHMRPEQFPVHSRTDGRFHVLLRSPERTEESYPQRQR